MINDEVDQTIADLTAAIEHVKANPWGHGVDYNPATGAFCAYGSVRAAVGGLIIDDGRIQHKDCVPMYSDGAAREVRDRASNVARAFYRIIGQDITAYNDMKGRTKDQMVCALETVLAELRKDPSRA